MADGYSGGKGKGGSKKAGTGKPSAAKARRRKSEWNGGLDLPV